MKKIVPIVIAVLVVGGVLAFVLMSGSDSDTPSESSTTNQTQAPSQSAEDTSPQTPAPSETTIVFTDSGFDPSNYEVAVGGTVTVQNDSSSSLEFSSDSHPTHQDNPELNTEVIEPGETTTFVAETEGEWGFHDHLDHTKTGILTVR